MINVARGAVHRVKSHPRRWMAALGCHRDNGIKVVSLMLHGVLLFFLKKFQHAGRSAERADFVFPPMCVPPGRPHRIQTHMNIDDGARPKVPLWSQIEHLGLDYTLNTCQGADNSGDICLLQICLLTFATIQGRHLSKPNVCSAYVSGADFIQCYHHSLKVLSSARFSFDAADLPT
jgi:hypothetical protein